MKSVMSHKFSEVPKVQIPRSQFDRSHGYKTTFDAGDLVPIYVDEALPGDTFNLKLTTFARLATPIKPIMDNMTMDTFFFSVPYRLVWDNWQKFNGEQINPDDSTDFLVPQMVSPVGGYLSGSTSDYFGIPTLVAGLSHSSLWHRSMNLIYNEWFRDQNLQDSVIVNRDDGPDLDTDYPLLKRGKRHDYFTSCLPWPQKGTAVEIPLGETAPLIRPDGAGGSVMREIATDNSINNSITYATNSAGEMVVGGLSAYVDSPLVADLSSATAATINSLRQAFQIQKLYEKDARGGTRYVETIKGHFGVTTPSQGWRSEYLGGGSTPVNITAQPQTQATSGGITPQANLAGYGVASSTSHGFTKSFTEHCLILGFINVKADLTYQDGLDRKFSRRTRWDFYWPSLAHIGEQAVLNKEIYAQGTANPVIDEEVFGYQERFAEYRYFPSKITGKFRSNDPQSLDVWHLSQDFGNLPTLNSDFITENPPIDRIIAVPSEPHFLLDTYFNIKTARPMPVYSVPGMIDHF